MSYKRTIALLNRNRVMATGHLDEIAAPKREVQATLIKHPDLQAYLDTAPTISREYLVPYLAGISVDGKTIYIDKGLPDVLPKTGIDVDKYIAIHERAEWWLMMRLHMSYIGNGDDSWGAHHYAVRLEHDALSLDGHDPDAYENELAPYIKRDERERVAPDTVPPDLFPGPYKEDEDSLDYEILPILAAAAVPLIGRKLNHAFVHYGPGHSPEYCRTCRYSSGEPLACKYVASIAPDGWCELWNKA